MDRSEFEAYFPPNGPVASAWAWLDSLLLREDIPDLWRRTAPKLRLALAQHLVLAQAWSQYRTEDELHRVAIALAEVEPTVEDWVHFQRGVHRILAEKYRHLDLATWSPMRPRPVGAEREVVLFVYNPSGDRVIAPAESFVATPFLLIRADAEEWQVAGFGPREPTPGWPPKFSEDANIEY